MKKEINITDTKLNKLQELLNQKLHGYINIRIQLPTETITGAINKLFIQDNIITCMFIDNENISINNFNIEDIVDVSAFCDESGEPVFLTDLQENSDLLEEIEEQEYHEALKQAREYYEDQEKIYKYSHGQLSEIELTEFIEDYTKHGIIEISKKQGHKIEYEDRVRAKDKIIY